MKRSALAPLILALACASGVSAAETVAELDGEKYRNMALPDCGFQKAIDEAAAAGGGVVRLPEGTFPLRHGLVLKDGVQIVGAGMDKTVLVPAREQLRFDVTKDSPDGDGKVWLSTVPESMDAGSAVVACDRYPPAWYGAPRPAIVTSVDRGAKTVTLEAPYGLPRLKAGSGLLVYGDTAAPAKSVAKGDTEIALRNASLFRPGDELAIGEPGNESMLAHAFVKEVRGNVLVLEEAARIDFEAWPDTQKIGNTKVNALIFALFPMVHGANIKNAAIRDLTCKGRGMERVRPMNSRYTLSGIHLFNAIDVKIERVAVRDWPADGISVQTGERTLMSHCEATGCLGNGFHPGTGLKDSIIEDSVAERNGDGIYLCWHNRGHIFRRNRIVRNKGGGITGLGNPGDRNNVFEENLIAENGGPGIAINGGLVSGNVIRNNTIENNSRADPGKAPGILLHAAVEDARNYTITDNTIRDTQAAPTQHVGIEERNGVRNNKPTAADENLIENNTYSGHTVADVIVVGPATVVREKPEVKVLRRAELEKPEAKSEK